MRPEPSDLSLALSSRLSRSLALSEEMVLIAHVCPACRAAVRGRQDVLKVLIDKFQQTPMGTLAPP
jgi:hypothetical protein